MEQSREVLAEQNTVPQDDGSADWYVFEAIVADGSWSIGILRGTPIREHVMVVEEGLTRAEAEDVARGIGVGRADT